MKIHNLMWIGPKTQLGDVYIWIAWSFLLVLNMSIIHFCYVCVVIKQYTTISAREARCWYVHRLADDIYLLVILFLNIQFMVMLYTAWVINMQRKCFYHQGSVIEYLSWFVSSKFDQFLNAYGLFWMICMENKLYSTSLK